MNILHQYIDKILKPTNDLMNFVPSKINKIANVLKNNSTLSLNEVISGGSYKKGTMLRYKPDIDIVLVFNKQEGIKRNWVSLMNQVNNNLKTAFPKSKITKGDNIAIHLEFINNNKPINFDVVASYYVNSPVQMSSVKNSKIYQGITSLWHLRYFDKWKNIEYFKEVVMLLKDWKNKHKINLKSFHMELIAASAYEYRLENNYTLETFLISCFQNIQGMIDGTPIFPVNWEYFDKSSLNTHYDFPLLIDPANPNENLLKNLSAENAKNIKNKATKAIAHIKKGFFGKVFDPKNQTKIFKD